MMIFREPHVKNVWTFGQMKVTKLKKKKKALVFIFNICKVFISNNNLVETNYAFNYGKKIISWKIIVLSILTI